MAHSNVRPAFPAVVPTDAPHACPVPPAIVPIDALLLRDRPVAPAVAPRARHAARGVAPDPLLAPLDDDDASAKRSAGPWRGNSLASPPATAAVP
jgi:hypothetical protein